MHLDLDQINRLITFKAEPEHRAQWTDHILSCAACANRFRALNQLHQHELGGKSSARPWRYFAGAAAVLAMAVTPYLSQNGKTHKALAESAVDSVVTAGSVTQASGGNRLGVIDRVEQINYRDAVSNWGVSGNVKQIIDSKKDSQG